jgi:hypothetical protein
MQRQGSALRRGLLPSFGRSTQQQQAAAEAHNSSLMNLAASMRQQSLPPQPAASSGAAHAAGGSQLQTDSSALMEVNPLYGRSLTPSPEPGLSSSQQHYSLTPMRAEAVRPQRSAGGN